MNFGVIWENIQRNWETTVPGIIAQVALLVALFYPANTMFINQVAAVVAALAGLIFILLSKSANVTGTALNPRAQVQGLSTPAPSPTARVAIAAIAEADPALKFKSPTK
jgi:hypothetical protein